MFPSLVRVVALLLLAVPGAADAYGPMTHIGEADRNVSRLVGEGSPALSALATDIAASSEARFYLHLGAILPDLRETVSGLAFDTHDRRFALELLARAADPALSLEARAVCLGYAGHIASDIAAQVFAVPHFMASGKVGAADILPGVADDRPDGESELWTEGIIDVYYGDVASLLALYDHAAGDAAFLHTGLTAWFDGARATFGDAAVADPAAVEAQVQALLDRLARSLTPDRRAQLLGSLDLIRRLSLADIITVLDALGVLDDVVNLGFTATLDKAALQHAREVSPFFGDPYHFADYPAWLADLGPTILVESAAGAPWLTRWPTTRAQALSAATITSLAAFLGHGFAARDDIGLYDLRWVDGAGQPLGQIDARSALDLRLVVSLYPLAPSPAPFVVRVRKAVPGAPYLAGPVIAETPVATDEWSPLTWAGAPAREITVEVHLTPDVLRSAEGLHAELASQGAAGDRVFVTSSWEPFLAIAEIDTRGAAYASSFGTFDHFPGSLRVTSAVADETAPGAPWISAPRSLVASAPSLTVAVQALDPESGVCHYHLSLGRAPNSGELAELPGVEPQGTSRRADVTWTVPPATLAAGEQVYVTAIAENCVGLRSAATVTMIPVVEEEGAGGCGVAGPARERVRPPAWLALLLAAPLGRRVVRRAKGEQ